MNVLIVGANSFVGKGVGAWFAQKETHPRISYLSVRNDGWEQGDYADYDVVIFTAAIVHRPEVTDPRLYEAVNAALPFAFAKLVKQQGVKQFIFLSSVGVYNSPRALPEANQIGRDTVPAPVTLYGRSKLQGEDKLRTLIDADFCVSIVRPTYVYGTDCRGKHLAVFADLTRRLPFLPRAYENVRMGMVYIDNLAELCWLIANSGRSGIYPAQDREVYSTYAIMKIMGAVLCPGKRSVGCTWLFRPVRRSSLVLRLFGGSLYTAEFARCPLGDYQLVPAEEGIRRTLSSLQ